MTAIETHSLVQTDGHTDQPTEVQIPPVNYSSLAPRVIPEHYAAWNAKYGSPSGFAETPSLSFGKRLLRQCGLLQRCCRWDPFAFQQNTSTRAFEYPWAFYVADVWPGMRALEIGGGKSGFQFVLSRAGCSVTNVDPGQEELVKSWDCDPNTISKLNQRFGTRVELKNTTIAQAGLEDESFDRAYSISCLEHLPKNEIVEVMQHVYRVLKPNGLFVLTVDLFLNVEPFTRRKRNEFGRNVNIRWLCEQAPFRICHEETSEFYGFDGFCAERILANLENYFIGTYPVLSQCFVLEKPEATDD
jgi:ubiquinone/menaquinone biosynthesis C-methylase UbiE